MKQDLKSAVCVYLHRLCVVASEVQENFSLSIKFVLVDFDVRKLE